jgi:tetratricopeptide (TPR) repeat protein
MKAGRVLCLIGAVALAVACQGDEARLSEHLERGATFAEEEQWAEAVIEYRNVLQLDPNHAEAHYGLAKAHLAQKDVARGFWELEETVRLDPTNLDARLQHGQLLLFGKPDDLARALESADAILAVDPSRWEAHALRARALSSMARPDEATESYAAAAAAAPEEPVPLLLYANHLRNLGRNEEAEDRFRALTETEPGFASFAAYGGFLAGLGDRDEDALASYQRGLELAEEAERVAATKILANFLISRDRAEEAEAVLLGALEAQPDDLDLIYALARLYHAQERTELADEMIQQATRARPEDPAPFLLLSNYRGRNGDLAGALEAADQALEAAPDSDLARLRKAEVLVDLGYREKKPRRIAEGRSIVDAIIARDPAHPEALFVKAKIHLAEDELDEGLAALRRVLDLKPDWAQAHFLLGSTQLLKGDRTGARGSLVRALELDANLVEAHRMLARVHAALGDHELAVEAGNRLLERREDDAATRILVAQSLVRQGQLDAALAQLQRIPAAERDVDAHYAIGRVYRLLGDAEEARKHLLAAHRVRETHAEILRALLDLDVRDGRIRESVERIEAALVQDPTDPKLQVLGGEVAVYTGRPGEAEARFRRAIELDPNDVRAYQSLARYLALAGRSAEVVSTYERALEAHSSSGSLHLVLGSLYEAQGRLEEAMEQYQSAIRLNPDLAVAKNNLAYLMADRGQNLDRALDLAQEAKALLPDNPNTADTLGWVLYKKDVPGAAIPYLREAVGGMPADDPNLPLVRHHLALAYAANDEDARAREEWDSALRELDAQLAPDGDRPQRPEPGWAQEIRAGLEQLGG